MFCSTATYKIVFFVLFQVRRRVRLEGHNATVVLFLALGPGLGIELGPIVPALRRRSDGEFPGRLSCGRFLAHVN